MIASHDDLICHIDLWPVAPVSSALARSAAVAVGSLPRRMGFAKRRRNSWSSPKTPGFARLTRVKNSSRPH